jgi:hippurate hydrolase
MVEQRMRDIAQHTAAAFGATVNFEFHRNYPPTINHHAEADFVRSVMQDLVGPAHTHEFEPTMGAEDFSYFLQAKPGAYFVIGNGDGAHRAAYSLGHDAAHLGPCNLHNPHYDFNDELIPLGGSLWVKLVEKFLAKG